ncbi:hypothetical protein PANT_19c00065 [Moesziomyces antarcticus T-34]|uniref:Uncharacterized protein n=1 Tax=Pseudozyma antarctica (strain T-34) TaxID=1151754 RepID=M9MHE8_PSEA3|nr:hypothetical protein PANT_19c00065 [Moesziomyces antarcticus T-34]
MLGTPALQMDVEAHRRGARPGQIPGPGFGPESAQHTTPLQYSNSFGTDGSEEQQHALHGRRPAARNSHLPGQQLLLHLRRPLREVQSSAEQCSAVQCSEASTRNLDEWAKAGDSAAGSPAGSRARGQRVSSSERASTALTCPRPSLARRISHSTAAAAILQVRRRPFLLRFLDPVWPSLPAFAFRHRLQPARLAAGLLLHHHLRFRTPSRHHHCNRIAPRLKHPPSRFLNASQPESLLAETIVNVDPCISLAPAPGSPSIIKERVKASQ